MKSASSCRKTEGGFTLLEVLLAVSLTGFVLAAATTLIVSVSNIWTNRQTSHFFADHVDGVTEFLKASFDEAGTAIVLAGSDSPSRGDNNDSDGNAPNLEVSVGRSERTGPSSGSGAGLIQQPENSIAWERPPGFRSSQDSLLNFRLREKPPLLINPESAPTLSVNIYLHFERNTGLSLLWHPILQEEVEDERDFLRTLVSPYVTELIYVYWDDRFDRWQEQAEPLEEDGEFELPSYLKLRFEHEGVTAERTIALPPTSISALLF